MVGRSSQHGELYKGAAALGRLRTTDCIYHLSPVFPQLLLKHNPYSEAPALSSDLTHLHKQTIVDVEQVTSLFTKHLNRI